MGAGLGFLAHGPDCIGWAPLPPGPSFSLTILCSDCDSAYGLSPSIYCFIESSRFGSRSYLNLNSSLTHVSRIYAGTMDVTRLVRLDRPEGRLFAHRGGPAGTPQGPRAVADA